MPVTTEKKIENDIKLLEQNAYNEYIILIEKKMNSKILETTI